MRKVLVTLTGVAVVAAAAWSGLWFYGKGRIAEEIETQAQLIRERGGEAAFDAVEVSGFPFGYEGRITNPKFSMMQEISAPTGDAPGQAILNWSAPWIKASAGVMNPNSVEFTFPETQDILLDLPELDGQPLPIALTSQDLKIVTEREGNDILFRGGATQMGGSFSRDSEKSGQIDFIYTMRNLKTSGTIQEPQADVERPQIAVTYSIDGFEGSGNVAGTSDSPGGKIDFTGGAVSGEGNSLGAETLGEATFNDIAGTLQVVQLGTPPLEMGIGKIEAKTRIPNDASPEPQAFGYRLGFEDVTFADLIWTMLDPQQAFTREINAITLDVEGTAIFIATPSNAEAFAKAMQNGLPIDLKTLTLNDLTVDAIGLKATADGKGKLENNAPQGKAALAVEGFPTLMNSLVKSGRIPPQQAMVVQLMVESFGKMDEDEKTVRFDFEARDGMMYVNSVPIGEAPMLPR